jgi:hypothetical protein
MTSHYNWRCRSDLCKLSKSGSYTSKSSYEAFSSAQFGLHHRRVCGGLWAPLRCKFFIWLAIKNRCWTANGLTKRGLTHPAACPLCDQENETVQHLLVSCVFACQVWYIILQKPQLLLVRMYCNSPYWTYGPWALYIVTLAFQAI